MEATSTSSTPTKLRINLTSPTFDDGSSPEAETARHHRQGSSDSALGESAVTSPDVAVKKITSNRNSEENFESYGENDDVEYEK